MDGLLVHVGSEVDMAEGMTEEQIAFSERYNSGTSWTHNDSFEKNGYLVIKNLYDPDKLYHPVPEKKGQYNYYTKSTDKFNYQEVENQVEGSTSRYWHPQYRQVHTDIRFKLEKILGRKLYNTYYYDRYYFPGQELKKHADRDACEISVTVHIGTNLEDEEKDWPIWIKTPDTYSDNKKTSILVNGEDRSVILQPGDGMIYKGCERPHWRDPMPGKKKNIFGKSVETYYHQIFFHYVLQDGHRAHCAWDASR